MIDFSPATLVIVSPSARRLMPAVADCLRAHGLTPVPAEPTAPDAIGGAIRDHAGTVARVVVGGGDGTIRHAAAALAETGLPLGILPLGTANDLAHSIGLPMNWRDAAAVIAAGKTIAADLGDVNGESFFNAAQIGLGATVGRWLSPTRKRLWGGWAYGVATVDAMRFARSFDARIEANGTRMSLRSVHITVGNGSRYGGGTLVAADASISDSRLDLFSIDPLPPWRLAMLSVAIRTGRQSRRSRHLHRIRGDRIRIATDRPMTVTADGEDVTRTPADFRVRPAAVRLYAPA